MDTIRIQVADDLAVVRAGLKVLLDGQADMVVVGEGVLDTAVELAYEIHPDVVIVDPAEQGSDGWHVIEQLNWRCPDCRILILATHEDPHSTQLALQAGAGGYVPKRASVEELFQAVRVVARGGLYLASRPGRQGFADLTAAESPQLSGREVEVLRLIATGFSNKEVAARLKVSVKTVETHKARSMEKLGFHSRVDLVRYALRRGWLHREDGCEQPTHNGRFTPCLAVGGR